VKFSFVDISGFSFYGIRKFTYNKSRLAF